MLFKNKKDIVRWNIIFAICGYFIGTIGAYLYQLTQNQMNSLISFWTFGLLGIIIVEIIFGLLYIRNFFPKRNTTSILEIFNIESNERTVLKKFVNTIIESPNWRRDTNSIIYNSKGKIWNYDMDSKEVTLVETGFLTHCNNDHVLSPSGKGIAISDNHMMSRIYTLEWVSAKPVLVTEKAPSYLHGWSPDGKYLTYCALRNRQYDIYSISVTGGKENQLTNAKGHNDGPENSPDGKHIWFNSARTGLMQIWRMNTDGSEQKQITFDEDCNSWFPHISPDGKKVVYLVFNKNDLLPNEHLPDKNVELRIMNYDGKETKTLLKLYGGQGTINTNSWSPCGKYIAFVRYEHF